VSEVHINVRLEKGAVYTAFAAAQATWSRGLLLRVFKHSSKFFFMQWRHFLGELAQPFERSSNFFYP
jgi:hypothetical protein